MKPRPDIRSLGPEDLESSACLIRRAFATVATDFGLTRENCPGNGAFLETEKLRRDFARGIRMFGLFADQEQAGFVAVKPRDESVWYLEKLAVAPEWRHQGFGAALLLHAIADIRAQGGKSISIGIIADNLRLMRWYERFGFQSAGTKSFVSLPFLVLYMTVDL